MITAEKRLEAIELLLQRADAIANHTPGCSEWSHLAWAAYLAVPWDGIWFGDRWETTMEAAARLQQGWKP